MLGWLVWTVQYTYKGIARTVMSFDNAASHLYSTGNLDYLADIVTAAAASLQYVANFGVIGLGVAEIFLDYHHLNAFPLLGAMLALYLAFAVVAHLLAGLLALFVASILMSFKVVLFDTLAMPLSIATVCFALGLQTLIGYVALHQWLAAFLENPRFGDYMPAPTWVWSPFVTALGAVDIALSLGVVGLLAYWLFLAPGAWAGNLLRWAAGSCAIQFWAIAGAVAGLFGRWEVGPDGAAAVYTRYAEAMSNLSVAVLDQPLAVGAAPIRDPLSG